MTTAHHNCKVLAYDSPLLRYEQAGRERIINTSSPAFARAEPQPPVPEKATLDLSPTFILPPKRES
jgi:hypothetical protein